HVPGAAAVPQVPPADGVGNAGRLALHVMTTMAADDLSADADCGATTLSSVNAAVTTINRVIARLARIGFAPHLNAEELFSSSWTAPLVLPADLHRSPCTGPDHQRRDRERRDV